MDEFVAPFPKSLGGYREQRAETSGFAVYFSSIMAQDPRFNGARLLDVGCGAKGPKIQDRNGNELYEPLLKRARQVDGVEPGPDISQHPYLTKRFQTTLEGAELEPDAYDLLVSFNVLEHVEKPTEFLKAAYRALKPGGAFYAVTPHGFHPFVIGVWMVEKSGLKRGIAERAEEGRINKIPTYYRLNTRSAITPAAEKVGFARVSYYKAPCVNWDTYFVGPTKIVPRAFDRLIGSRSSTFAQQLLVVFEKGPLAERVGKA